MNRDEIQRKSITEIFNEMEYEQKICNLQTSVESSKIDSSHNELSQALKFLKQPKTFESALHSAIQVQNKWRGLSAPKRAHALHKIWKELGKTAIPSIFKADFSILVDFFDFYSDLAIQTEEYWTPHGVVLILLPEHSPNFVLGATVPAALAAGCVVIVYVPEKAKILSLILEKVIEAVGLPEGVFNVVTQLISFPEIKKVNKAFFCGPYLAANQFYRKSLAKSFNFFCPNNTSALILESCDLNAAVTKIVTETWGKNSLFAVSNIVVQESIHKIFLEKLKERLDQFLTENINSSKFNDKITSERINKVIFEATKAGAEIVKCTKYENKIEWSPTIIVNYQSQHIQEDVPILKVLLCRTAKEGVTLINNCRYGLGTSIWSEISSQALEISFMLDSPNIWINCHGVVEAGEPLQLSGISGNCVLGGSDGILEYMSFRLNNATTLEENNTNEDKNNSGDKTEVLQMAMSAQQAFKIWGKIKSRRKYFKDIAIALEDNKELSELSEMISNYAHFGNTFNFSKKNSAHEFSVIRNKVPVGVILLIITSTNIDTKSIASLITPAIVLGNAVIVILQEYNSTVKLLIKTFISFLPQNILNVVVGINAGIHLASDPNVQAIWLYEESTVSVQFFETIKSHSERGLKHIWIVPKNFHVSEPLFAKECLQNKVIWMTKVDQFP